MAVKFTKGQICNGTISKSICHKEYNLHGKFHTCFTKCTTFALCRSTISSLQSYVPRAKALANHPTCIQAVGQKILAKMEMAIPEPTQVDSELMNDTEVSDNCSLVNSCKKFV